ncbi:MAG: hypothetical protein D6734_07690, partial [Candidatus Schekmanbacteria bacterium]
MEERVFLLASERITIKSYLLLLALTVNSLFLNGYRFDYNILTSWLRKQSNPELFKNDFFVNTVDKVQISWFYEVIKRLSFYIDLSILFFLVHIFSLTLMCFFLFYLAYELTGKKIIGYASVLMFSMGIRQWVAGAPQVYYFFVHHSAFSLPFFLLILTLFFKGKRILAYFLLGVMTNFHLLFDMYVLVALSIPLLLAVYEKRCTIKEFVYLIIAFLIPAIPAINHAVQFSGEFKATPEWFRIVRWTIWIHILPSKWGFEIIRNFLVYFLCFFVAFRVYPNKEHKKNVASVLAGLGIFCAVGTFFVEVVPTQLFTQIQVWRSTWIFFILSIPIFANFIYLTWSDSLISKFASISTLLVFGGYVTTQFNDPRCYYETPFWMLPFFMLLSITVGDFNVSEKFRKASSIFIIIFSFIILGETLIPAFEGKYFDIGARRLFVLLLALGSALLFSWDFIKNLPSNRQVAVAILNLIAVFSAVILLRGGVYFPLKGYMDGREGDWERIQFYVRDNTPIDALFIVPPYLAYPDFRFYSKRASFGDWVEGGFSVYLGSEFAEGWARRMADIGLDGRTFFDESFQLERKQYASLSAQRIIEAGYKYGADFFVADKRKGQTLPFEKLYENKSFALYKIPLT